MDYYYRIQQAVEYIETNLQEDLGIDRIAAQACFSPYHFQRLFQAISGFSVWEYIRKRRLTEAANRLAETASNILEIAVAFRYNSQEAFTRAFEAYFGVTPAQYRKTVPFIAKQAKVNFLDYHGKIQGGLQLSRPNLIDLPSFKVTGLPYGANLENERYYLEIPAFWFDFYKRGCQKRILRRAEPNIALGVAFDTIQNNTLTYLIGAEVTLFESQLEPGFRHAVIPGGKYGEFKVKGAIRDVENAFRYIYGVWFPNSNYERADGPDIKAVHVGRSTSTRFEMEIRVPLK